MRTARLARRLRDYDWAAAFIELAIVVVGILIALRVSNWNQERVDHARAQGYYRRIHADLLTDRGNIDVTLAYWGKVSAYGSEAIAYGETGTLVDGSQWKTVLAWYQASQIFPFELANTTFEEMRSSGDLGLIADEKLRKELADYYRLSGTGVQAMIMNHNPVYRKEIRGLTPWRVQRYIWSHCFRETSFANQQLLDCPSPIDGREAASILETYRQSPTLLDHLRTWMSTLRVSGIVLRYTRKAAARLAAQVAAAETQ